MTTAFSQMIVPVEFQKDSYDTIFEGPRASVRGLASRLKDARVFEAVSIYLQICGCWGPVDEWNGAVERFYNLFKDNQTCLNGGVRSLDYVRECVRRSFGISEVVEFGQEDHRIYWQSPEKIEQMANALVEAGFVLPPNHGL